MQLHTREQHHGKARPQDQWNRQGDDRAGARPERQEADREHNDQGLEEAAGKFTDSLAHDARLVGDLTGDGIADLVVTASKGIYLRKGAGDGTFPNARFTPSDLVPGYVMLADFDQDGLLDVVTSNPYDGRVSVFRNTGQCH